MQQVSALPDGGSHSLKGKSSVIRPLAICLVWYSGSMLNSLAGKSAMKDFPFPTSVSVVQLLVINLMLPMFRTAKMPVLRRSDWTGWVVPLSVLKVLVTLSSQLSILKVPVSYAHTVKALMPFFTVLLSKLFLRQKHSALAYASLVPIMFGVIVASVTELEFDTIGLLSALFSTFIFAIQNIYSKKIMKGGLNHIVILIIVSRVSLAMLIPFWLFNEGIGLFSGTISFGDESTSMMSLVTKLVACGFGNSLQTIFAFTFLSLVTPVTYSVANVAKRVIIIVIATIVFQKEVTWMNGFGMAMAIAGIAMYNKAKLDEKMRAATLASVAKELPLHTRHEQNKQLPPHRFDL